MFKKWLKLRPAGVVFPVAHQLFVVAVCGPAQATISVPARSFCSQILLVALY